MSESACDDPCAYSDGPDLSAPSASAEFQVIQPLAPSSDAGARFAAEGYIVAESLLEADLCEQLVCRLDSMLAGVFDTGQSPDKVPQGVQTRKKRVEQFVNVWKGDRLFSSVVQSASLAQWVASVAGWADGATVLQDQVWCKPPGSGPIGFHRDAAYMGEGVVTLWLSLDDLEPSMGPLEYAGGSHLWPAPPFDGYTPALFGKRDYRSELNKAACLAGAEPEITQVLVRRGGGSLHDGRTWHGSGVNLSHAGRRAGRPRRGLGIHFGPTGSLPSPPTATARAIAS